MSAGSEIPICVVHPYRSQQPSRDPPRAPSHCRLRRGVLCNLISNAAKFTSEGDVVEMSVRRIDQKVRIEVADHGIGTAAEEQKDDHLFLRKADTQMVVSGLTRLFNSKSLSEQRSGKLRLCFSVINRLGMDLDKFCCLVLRPTPTQRAAQVFRGFRAPLPAGDKV
ncbi:ATP-binding protein [Sulfitobacter sp. 15WGC]|nr:ATP-binding protein [Sulfitobacter sp. 15WGC]